MIGSPHIRRAQLLIGQDRYGEAEKEIGLALQQNPENPFALAMLSECYLENDRRPEALDLARQAVAGAPHIGYFYHHLARAQFFNKQVDACKATIIEGLRINPNDADFFLLSSQIEFYLEDWAASLKAANQGLTIDPENINLINQRTQALVKLNRKSEAASSIDFALSRSPENALSHSNRGWVAIEQDDYEKAVTHFKESLRLDPTNEYTRSGLKEAIKAKNILYRYVLKYFLWMNKLQAKARWYFVIGIYAFYHFVLFISDTFPVLATILTPVIVLYILMAFSSWIAMPISNAFLRFHPLGKHAMTEDELKASSVVSLLLIGGIISVTSFYALGNSFELTDEGLFVTEGGETLFFLSMTLIFLMIPVGGFFKTLPGSKSRKQLGWGLGLLCFFGIAGIFTQAELFVNAFFIGILLFSLGANYVLGKDARAI